MLTPLDSYLKSTVNEYAKSRARGFTLIELLMVMAIISILAAITFGISKGVQNAQARAKAKAELAVLSQAIEQFKSRYGDYPWINASDVSVELQLRNASHELMKTLVGWQAYDGTQVGEKATSVLDVSKLSLSQEWPNSTIEASPSPETYLKDPWGNPYIYIYKDSTNASSWQRFGYILMSAGPDGEVNGDFLEESSGIYNTHSNFIAAEGNADNIYFGQ